MSQLIPRTPASVFLLFEEPTGGYEIPADASEYGAEVEQRRGWSAVAFGENYGLKLVGADLILFGAADRVPVAVQCSKR